MTDIQIFNNPQFGQLRAVTIDNEPWFVGKDVAERLGYSNARDALARHVDNDDKNTVVNHDGNRGNPNITIINESGLYSLVLSSKLPTAKAFKRWITSEVIPSIRKTGAYQMGAELNQLRAKNEEMEKAVELLTTCKNHLNKVRSEMAEVKAWQRDAKAKYMQAKANYGTWCDLARSYDEVIAKAQNNVNACIDNIQSLCMSSHFDNMGRLLDDDAMFNTLLDTVITPMMKEAASCKTTS